MAKTIVYMLEVIKINEQYANLPFFTFGPADGLLQAVQEKTTVWNIRQEVIIRPVFDLLLAFLISVMS